MARRPVVEDMHAGETEVPGMVGYAPSGFTGWTSRHLEHPYEDPGYARIDEELRSGSPALRCATTWRSSKWKIAPDDYELALRLRETLWTSESTDWVPEWSLTNLADRPEQEGTWLEVAMAIRDDDQRALDLTLAEARESYSPLGYRIASCRGSASLYVYHSRGRAGAAIGKQVSRALCKLD